MGAQVSEAFICCSPSSHYCLNHPFLPAWKNRVFHKPVPGAKNVEDHCSRGAEAVDGCRGSLGAYVGNMSREVIKFQV